MLSSLGLCGALFPIRCSFYRYCTNIELLANGDASYWCYGSSAKCLDFPDDCRTDTECAKYNYSSPRFTDMGRTCRNSGTPWGSETCRAQYKDNSTSQPTLVPTTAGTTARPTAASSRPTSQPTSRYSRGVWCGASQICVGLQKTASNLDANFYCYGRSDACMPYQCKMDSECEIYTTSSPRFSPGQTCSEFLSQNPSLNATFSGEPGSAEAIAFSLNFFPFDACSAFGEFSKTSAPTSTTGQTQVGLASCTSPLLGFVLLGIFSVLY